MKKTDYFVVTKCWLGLLFFVLPASAARASSLAKVNIGTTPGSAIPATFMGLSLEWGSPKRFMGDSTMGINTIFRQLLVNLTSYGSGPLIIRVGGNSSDTQKPPKSDIVQPFAEIAAAMGTHFYLGINLGSNNVNLAKEQAQAFVNQMPAGSLDGLEIGNEPDSYVNKKMRPSPYTLQDYITEFDTWKNAISTVVPTTTKFMGPSFYGFQGTAWGATLSNVQEFVSKEANALAVFSIHFYASYPGSHPPQDFLLSTKASAGGPSHVAAAVAAVHAAGIPFRLGEFNSISQGGVHGISDAFGSALWAVDTMFEYIKVGVDGINWHSSGGSYAPFYFSSAASQGMTIYSVSSINPLYYGLLFFQQATGNGARMLPVTLSTQANLKAWATVDKNGVTRVVILNKDESQSGSVTITMPGAGKGVLTKLSAPSFTSTSGVTLAGQTFDGTPDGKIVGTYQADTIIPQSGSYTISLGTVQGALLTISPR